MKDRLFGPLLARADRHPDLTDAAIAAGFVGLGLASFPLVWPEQRPVAPVVAVALLVALFAPLAWRRRRPLAALAVYTVLIAVYPLSGLPQNPMFDDAWLLAAYSAGAYGKGRGRTWVRAGSAAAFLVLHLVDAVSHGGPGTMGNPVLGFGLYVATNSIFVAWIWLFGDVACAAREREAELAERTRQLEQEREVNARRAVLAERVRIARELHDVVAHHVSLMGVQAGAARRVLHQRPDQAEQALSAIETTSREAVRELHRLLGFLRQEQEADGLAPPTLRCLDDLLAQMREAGLPVALEIEGKERPLPPAVDLSAYRIVQEALTNTLRHAGPASATVRLRYDPRELLIDVIDDGNVTVAPDRTSALARTGGSAGDPIGGQPGGAASGGVGLIGMHERVGLLGGWLRLERPPGGGFAVRAALPTDGRSA